jgi:phosphoglycolate phosphatase
VRFALDACHASVASAVVVGDGETDILAGKTAGAFTVGVTYGFRSAGQLAAAGADVLVDRMDDLLTALGDAGLRS